MTTIAMFLFRSILILTASQDEKKIKVVFERISELKESTTEDQFNKMMKV